jgi:hypothetical protein
MTAFPGLTNTDMAGADPWHGYFSGNLGSLSVLGTAQHTVGGVTTTRNIIIGGGAGTVITPDPPPPTGSVPDSLPILAILPAFAALLLGGSRFRRVRD